jgi:hypothetical protein
MSPDSSVRAEASRLLGPDFDLAHKMQRLALDAAWKQFPTDAEMREMLANVLREHGLAVRRLLAEGPDPETITRLQQLVTEWKCEAFADGVKAVAAAQRGDPLSDVLLACAKISQGHANQLLALLSQISPAQESR